MRLLPSFSFGWDQRQIMHHMRRRGGLLGIDSIKDAFKAVNMKLPAEHQLEKVTGHTERHSYVSGSINSGVDAVVVAQGSKHRSTKSLQRYNHPDDSQKVVAMTTMARAVRNYYSEDSDCDEN
jgi:site-specific recombinase XerD